MSKRTLEMVLGYFSHDNLIKKQKTFGQSLLIDLDSPLH